MSREAAAVQAAIDEARQVGTGYVQVTYTGEGWRFDHLPTDRVLVLPATDSVLAGVDEAIARG